jgi:hypothetical protein
MGMNPRLLRPTASGRFLLDLYGPAQFAYSLRRLRSGYSGPVVQVRRSNDNAEANFNADEVANGTLAAWVGAGNNGLVKTWYDQSLNGFHVEQGTSGNQPTIVSSGSLITDSGKPAVQFAASTGLITGAGFTSYTTSRSHTFAVCKNTSNNNSVRFLFEAQTERAVNRIQAFGNAQIFQRSLTPGTDLLIGTINSYYPQNSTTLSTVFYNNALGTWRAARNGGAFTDATQGSTGTPSITNLRISEATSFSWLGTISEIVIFTSDMAARRSLVEDNINRHYAIF